METITETPVETVGHKPGQGGAGGSIRLPGRPRETPLTWSDVPRDHHLMLASIRQVCEAQENLLLIQQAANLLRSDTLVVKLPGRK
jgi:hypothetical protein